MLYLPKFRLESSRAQKGREIEPPTKLAANPCFPAFNSKERRTSSLGKHTVSWFDYNKVSVLLISHTADDTSVKFYVCIVCERTWHEGIYDSKGQAEM